MTTNNIVYGWLDTELGELEGCFVELEDGTFELKDVSLNGYALYFFAALPQDIIDRLADSAMESIYG